MAFLTSLGMVSFNTYYQIKVKIALDNHINHNS